MKNALKKAISILLIAVMVFGAVPLAGFVGLELPELNLFSTKASAEEAPTSGSCGENLTWTFDRPTGKLVISGTGEMYYWSGSYYDENGKAPWESYCSLIKSVTINEGVTSIGSYAFNGCTSLASVTIPDGVTSIYSYAFNGCTSLASVTISDSVTRIEYNAFSGCTSLASVTIPDGVTDIGSYAFYGCTSLASVTIPDSVTSIGYEAFRGCTSLASVTIPDSVTYIDSCAFSDCTSLASVTIGNSVTYIGSSAFSGCTSLASVTIPDSVATIGDYAFGKNTQILCNKDSAAHKFAEDGSLAYWLLDDDTQEKTISGKIGTKLTWTIDRKNRKLTVENNGTMISFVSETAPWVQYSHYINSAEIVYGCTNISQNAFEGCRYLKTVDIPYSVTRIDSSAFFNCTSLASVTIPDSVTDIGSHAFYGCTSLASVTIPDGVTGIGLQTFYDCTNLASVTIPDSVTYIDSFAFEGCTSLASVTIPDSVTSIGSLAFSGCTSLEAVTIGKNLTHMDNRAFANCPKLSDIYFYSKNCSISESSISIYAAIHAYIGSTAEAFADKYGYEFIPIVDNPCAEHAYDNGCDIYCNVCGYKREITHTFGEWETVKEPTCQVQGVKKHVCSVCRYSELAAIEELKNHAYSDVCDITCNICGEIRTTHHDFSEWQVTKEPTCAEYGEKERTCSACKSKETDYIAKLTEHSFTNSCDEDCNVCGKTRGINHSFGAWQIIKDPTCSETGRKERVCSASGCVESEEIPALSHTDEDDNGICEVCKTQFETKPVHSGTCGENLTWTLDESTGELVISGTGKMDDWIAAPWVNYIQSIKSATISDGVTSIGQNAFYHCLLLRKITIPDSVISIAPFSIISDEQLTIICKNGSYAHVYAAQNGIKYILEDNNGTAFEIRNNVLIKYGGSAENVVLPADILMVGTKAFKDSAVVKHIELPYSVSKIYNGAFSNCPNLESVVIPFTVTEIGDSAFSGTNAKIYCYNNSYAHNYAVEKGIAYELITVTLSTNSVKMLMGETVAVAAVPNVTLSCGVPCTWKSADTDVAAVSATGEITGNGAGETTVGVYAPNGTLLAECAVEISENTPDTPPSVDPAISVVIREPSTTTVKYGDSIVLHADLSEALPAGWSIKWESSNSNFSCSVSSDGTTCTISPNKSGDTTFTAIVYDAEGNIVSADEQTMTSKAGFFQKIIAFFKKLFGLTKTIPEAIKVTY